MKASIMSMLYLSLKCLYIFINMVSQFFKSHNLHEKTKSHTKIITAKRYVNGN